MDLHNRFLKLSERYLPDVLECVASVVGEATPSGSNLARMHAYHFETGGKRLRAVIPFLVTETFHADAAPLVPFAAACELVHNATLVHDDVQDGDAFRRGQETVWRRFGIPQAIDLGTAMHYYAVLAIHRLEVPGKLRDRVLSRLIRETLRVLDGQEREFALKRMEEPSVSEYLEMVQHKTSGLFRLPMVGAADLCGAKEYTLEALSRAASHLGILFQIQDDLLDLYGDKGRDERGSDVAEGKRSYLVVHALATLTTRQSKRLREILDLDRERTTPEHVAEVLDLLEACRAVQAAVAEIERQRAAAGESARKAGAEAERLVEGLADLFLRPIRHLLGGPTG